MDNHVYSSNFVLGDVRKVEKLGGFERKRLSDISNLQERPKPMNLDLKKKFTATITPKEYIDKLQKENKELMKLLEDRNELIKLSVVELQKIRVNLQKVQLQNLQLAQANSQMLAELNSGKDRLKVLQHDLACQNGLLQARKVVAVERRKRVAASQKPSKEADSSLRDELRKSCQEDMENEPMNGNQRRQTKKQSLGCPSVKPAHANEEANKKRRCSRRQSARLKTEDSEATEGSFEVNNAQCDVPSLHDDPLGISCQILADSSAKNENEGNPAFENTCLPVANVVAKTRRSRRESARFVKTLQPEATEDSFEVKEAPYPVPSLHDDPVGTSGQISAELSTKTDNEGIPAVGNACVPVVNVVDASKKRRSRRESAKFVKTAQPEATEDSFVIEDGIFDDSSIHNNVISANGQTTSRLSVKEEGGGNLSSGIKTGESRRSLVGRPLRQAAEKVHSYQETSLRAKMRRPE